MRKLKVIEHISLDGVVQVSGEDGDFPYGGWTAPYRTPAGQDLVMAAHGEPNREGAFRRASPIQSRHPLSFGKRSLAS